MNDEIVALPDGTWLIDGNYFHPYFCNNDENIAKQYAKTLINCFGCVDCINCRNCNHCNTCLHCIDCNNCTNGFRWKDSCNIAAPQLPLPPLQPKMPFIKTGNISGD